MLTSVLNIHVYLLIAWMLVIFSNLIIVLCSTSYSYFWSFIPSIRLYVKQQWNRRNDCLTPACVYVVVNLRYLSTCSNCAWMIYERFKEKCKYQNIKCFLWYIIHCMFYEHINVHNAGKKITWQCYSILTPKVSILWFKCL